MKYKKLNVIYDHIQSRIPTVSIEELPYLLYGFNYLMMFDTGLPGILIDYTSTLANDNYTLTLAKVYEIESVTESDRRMLTTAEVDALNEICSQYITSEPEAFKDILNALCPWKAYSIKSRLITPNSMNKIVCKRKQMVNNFEIE